MLSTMRRIYKETGFLGLLLRPFFRVAIRILEGCSLTLRCMLGQLPLRWFTRKSVAARLAKNVRLKDLHLNERCFILGNGPSMAFEKISLLKGETLIVCNQGHLFAQKHGLNPAYHAFVDPIFLNAEYAGFLDDIITLYRRKPVTVITTTQIADVINQHDHDLNLCELHQFLISDYVKAPSRQTPDLATVQYGFLSVIHAAIAAAIYMGFKEIYLLGCDMEFFIDPAKPFEHSYGKGKYGENNKTTAALFNWNQIELMDWCLREFRGFDVLRQIAEANGISIINAGKGGALNVYGRKSLAEVLEPGSNKA